MYPVDRVYKDMTVEGGTNHGFRLETLPRGQIGKFLVAQTSGALEGFSYALYNHVAACPPGADPKAAASADAAAHLVCEPVTVEAGVDSNLELGMRMLHPYQNLDSLDGRRSSDAMQHNHGFLYLKIDAKGSGTKTFAAALCVYDPSNM